MQLLGAILIIAAVLLMWLSKRIPRFHKRTMWAAVLCLVAVGVIDLALVAGGQPTITQFIQSHIPVWSGYGLMIAFALFTWWMWGIAGLLPTLTGVIAGHLFWSR